MELPDIWWKHWTTSSRPFPLIKVGGGGWLLEICTRIYKLYTEIKSSIGFIKHSAEFASFNTSVEMVLCIQIILYCEALKLCWFCIRTRCPLVGLLTEFTDNWNWLTDRSCTYINFQSKCLPWERRMPHNFNPIAHYADISLYCTGSVVVMEVNWLDVLLYY